MQLTLALVISGGLHMVLLFAHGCHIAISHGIKWGVGRRSEQLVRDDLDRRFERSIANNVESLAAFIPVCVAAIYADLNGPTTELAVLAYIIARFGFLSAYLADIPYIRTVFWLTGQGAILSIFLNGLIAITSST